MIDISVSRNDTRSETSSARISQSLAAEIISGDLPPGSKLEEAALSKRFGVSRTPVREALKDLAAKQLVQAVRRGVVVARIGVDQLADMLEADCEMQAVCARLASQKMTVLEKEHLKIVFERAGVAADADDSQAFHSLNDEFHLLVINGTHNSTLVANSLALRNRLAPFRRTQPGDMQMRMLQSVQEHKRILEAILSSRPEEAYLAAREHSARLSAGALLRISECLPANEIDDRQQAAGVGTRRKAKLPRVPDVKNEDKKRISSGIMAPDDGPLSDIGGERDGSRVGQAPETLSGSMTRGRRRAVSRG